MNLSSDKKHHSEYTPNPKTFSPTPPPALPTKPLPVPNTGPFAVTFAMLRGSYRCI